MEDFSLHILDVAENGINAGANLIRIAIEENIESDQLIITIEDNGRGMSPEFVKRVLDPFVTTRTTRKVGLGLSLFQQSAQEADGDLKVESSLGVGTKVTAWMALSHIDRKPLGNVPATILTLIEGNPQVDFVYRHGRRGGEYLLDTREIRAELEEIPINNPEVVRLIRDDLQSGIRDVA